MLLFDQDVKYLFKNGSMSLLIFVGFVLQEQIKIANSNTAKNFRMVIQFLKDIERAA